MRKIKYFVTMTGENLMVKRFTFTVDQKEEAIALAKNLSLRYRDVEIFSIDSEDEDIVYNLTKKYIA